MAGEKKHFSDKKKKLVKVTATYFSFQSVEKLTLLKIPSVVFRFEEENFRGLLSYVSGGKPCKQRSSRSNLLSDCEAKLDIGWKIGEFGPCRQRKIKFDEF